MNLVSFIISILSIFAIQSCSNTDLHETDPVIIKGKGIYVTSCTMCHNPNPSIKGLVGPVLTGVEFMQFTETLIKGKNGRMPAFPHLQDDSVAIYKYINQSKFLTRPEKN